MTADCETNCPSWGLKKGGSILIMTTLQVCLRKNSLQKEHFSREDEHFLVQNNWTEHLQQLQCGDWFPRLSPETEAFTHKNPASCYISQRWARLCDGIRTRTGEKNISSSVLSWLESEKCFVAKWKPGRRKKMLLLPFGFYIDNLTINWLDPPSRDATWLMWISAWTCFTLLFWTSRCRWKQR